MAAAISLATVLEAQRIEVSPSVGFFRPSKSPLGSLPDNQNKKDDDTKIKQDRGFGVRVTWNTRGYYGFEGSYMRAQNRLSARVAPAGQTAETREDKINVDHAAFNFLAYFMPAGERWRPFITGGVLSQKYGEPNFAGWTRGAARTYGANYGGGIKLMLFKNALIRLDVRDHIGGKPYDLSFEDQRRLTGGLLRTLEASAGISIAF